MITWISATLGRTFGAALAAVLLSASLGFGVLFVGLYRSQLESHRAQASQQTTLLLQATLENAMLKRDLDGLTTVIGRLGHQEGVRRVLIVNPAGEVRFASDPATTGTAFATAGISGWPEVTRADFLADGVTLRTIRAVRNREPCQQCHGPMTEHPINGVLVVDYDAAPVLDAARQSAIVLLGAGTAVVTAMVLAMWVLLRRLVLSPLAQLSQASRAIANGDLDTRVDTRGEDEISHLGVTFNAMADTLRDRIRDIRDHETFLQSLIDAIPDAIRVIGADSRIVAINRAYRQQLVLGEAVVVGQPCHLSSHASANPCPPTLVTCPLDVLSRQAGPVRALHEHHRADGSLIEVEIFAAPMVIDQGGERRFYVVESIRDLAADVRFSHEQKLAAVGQLAAGVAHEIRNPLASIRLALQGILRELAAKGGDEESLAYLRLVDGQIDKCIDVNNRLLKLSAGAGQQRVLIDVNQAVTETLSLLSWHAAELKIHVQSRLDPAIPRLLAPEGDLRMVLVNLVQNAFHAMPSGGDLIVLTQAAEGRVSLVVADTGVGVRSELRRRIFEPFFSHRADGEQGTGLGLAICKSIVDDLGGSIQVDSEPGRGARFTVSLPSAETVIDGGGRP